MPLAPELNQSVRDTAALMERFEASASRANIGTGARREGGKFEVLVGTLWTQVAALCVDAGAQQSEVRGPGTRWFHRLCVDDRELLLPLGRRPGMRNEPASRWLETDFGVTDLVAAFPGTEESIARYAPPTGPFAGEEYPAMFEGLSTRFDDTIVLVQAGVLREKILLEYKTAKSSNGRQVDANVHERLSFQMMQYLEAATKYTRCSFVVLSNGAFARYRNSLSQ
ncbi:MAG: hypothetical protein Q9O74_03180 [Planctomycetota bacterium]|nr:hypothetical protein [Planctomycetota bacterium]